MFVNYFKDNTRSTPFNLFAARILLSTYTIWRVLSYDWSAVAGWPTPRRTHWTVVVPEFWYQYLWIEQWILVVFLILFGIGYRLKFTGLVSGFLCIHLSVALLLLIHQWYARALGMLGVFIILFALYSEQDKITASSLGSSLEKPGHNSVSSNKYRLDALKWSLVIMSLMYTIGGLDKIIQGPIYEWTRPEHMMRLIHLKEIQHGVEISYGRLLIDYPLLSWLAAWGTIILETFVIAAIFVGGIWFNIFILGLLGMHVGIYLFMQVTFIHPFILFGLYLPFDFILSRIMRDETIEVIYTQEPSCWTKFLYLVSYADVNGSIEIYDACSTSESSIEEESVSEEHKLLVYREGKIYHNWSGIKELLRHFRFLPL